jgi:uncharacterized membrane protein
MESTHMTYGPIQLVVTVFARTELPREVVEQIRKVREAGTIRMISACFVAKDGDGQIRLVEETDLSDAEAVELRRLAGALMGFGYAGEAGALLGADLAQLAAEAGEFGLTRRELDDIAAQIPGGASALIALFEHRWAIGVKEAVRAVGGQVVSSGFVTADMLIEAGEALAAAEEADEARTEPVRFDA